MSIMNSESSVLGRQNLRDFDLASLSAVLFESNPGAVAEVAVIVPLYNYGDVIQQTLESVTRQDLKEISIVVVDDSSTDDGGDKAIAYLKDHCERFVNAKVLRHHRNQGLSMSRNSGIAATVEPYLFMLDADNLIRPHALSRLLSALKNSGADFAYSQLILFGDEVGIGNGDIWSPEKLARGNYIDAMALIRREALAAVNGYSVLAEDLGWEDYDLWCRFASVDSEGIFVPELLCDYRVHESSMLRTTTNRNVDALYAEMQLRHPRLFARSKQIRDVHINIRDWQKEIRLGDNRTPHLEKPLGIFIHLYYDDLAEEIASCLQAFDLPMQIYISTGSEEKVRNIRDVFSRHGFKSNVEIEIVPDYGTDIAPLVVGFADRLPKHDICLKIHSKKSMHSASIFGENWRKHLFRELMADRGRVRSIVNVMLADPELGVLVPQHWDAVRQWIGVGSNLKVTKKVLKRIGVSIDRDQEIEYPAGSMFWFRGEALADLRNLGFDWHDFGHAVDRKDGQLEHGFERSFLYFCAHAGKKWAFLPPTYNAPLLPRDRVIELIRNSGLFDENYYFRTYPDIKDKPLEHWVDHGAREGRNPSATFNTAYYRCFVPGASVNPLVHYIEEGRKMGLPTMDNSKS